MDRALVALALGAVAVAVALLLQRRRRDAPTTPTGGFRAPSQLDRTEVGATQRPWLVVVFTSATCSTCAAVWSAAKVLDSDEVEAVELESTRDGELHRRYGIDAVPITVVADAEGVVQRSFVGPVSATELWAALAELRDGTGEEA